MTLVADPVKKPTRREQIHKLTAELVALRDSYYVVRTTFHDLERLLGQQRSQSQKTRENGAYAFIPYEVYHFVEACRFVTCQYLPLSGFHTRKFLDVGCGIGSKLWLARRFFDRCDGIEFDQGYVEESRRYLSLGSNVIQADALTFPCYKEYDVIYFYHPMMGQKQFDLQEIIAQRCKPGAVIMAGRCPPWPFYPNSRPDRLLSDKPRTTFPKFEVLSEGEFGGMTIYRKL